MAQALPKFLPEPIVDCLENEYPIGRELFLTEFVRCNREPTGDECGVCLEPMDGENSGGCAEYGEDAESEENQGSIAWNTTCTHKLHRGCIGAITKGEETRAMLCPHCRAVWWHNDKTTRAASVIGGMIHKIGNNFRGWAPRANPLIRNIEGESLIFALQIAAYATFGGVATPPRLSRNTCARILTTSAFRNRFASVVARAERFEESTLSMEDAVIALARSYGVEEGTEIPTDREVLDGKATLEIMASVVTNGLSLYARYNVRGMDLIEVVYREDY